LSRDQFLSGGLGKIEIAVKDARTFIVCLGLKTLVQKHHRKKTTLLKRVPSHAGKKGGSGKRK